MKVGEANYGSRDASVNLELELDSSLVGAPDRLKERIALNAIADRKQISLPELLTARFQIQEPSGLTITEASSLIDELKGPGGAVAR
ncbi:MAG: hypothetical protein C0483_01010 [Pirellula sp.]|nr:hypothetical protein [Pirellula sp.]